MFPQPVIALWTKHPGDLLGEAITFLTHGPAQHAGWIGSDGVTIYEAYLPKTRRRPITEQEKPAVRLFTLEGMTPELAKAFERWLKVATDPQFAEEYSVRGLFGFALNIPPPDEQHVFCSEWVMQSIRQVAPELIPLARCEDYQASPVDLLRSIRLHEVAWTDVLKPLVFTPLPTVAQAT
jgi:hypothetical protein